MFRFFIDLCVHQNAFHEYCYFAFLGIFMHQGCRTQRLIYNKVTAYFLCMDKRLFVDRLGKLPSKEQQLSRTQHFILKAHAAIFVLHIQYGPRGTPLTHTMVSAEFLTSTPLSITRCSGRGCGSHGT